MQEALAMQATDRVYRVGVNRGLYLTHQFEQVTEDHWSALRIGALYNLGRAEEASLLAQKRAANGSVGAWFALLNASDQSSVLIDYFETHWPTLTAFSQAVPASMFGYREMADIALAYRRAGDQARMLEHLNRERQQLGLAPLST